MPPTKISTHFTSSPTIPLLIDGALATYLEHLGADISGSLWSASILLSQPELIKKTHLDYYRAGANIAITASYQASIAGLIAHLGLSEGEAKSVVGKSVELAIEARDMYVREKLEGSCERSVDEEGLRGDLFVAGSVGPYGAFLSDGSEYRGDYLVAHDVMKEFHRGRIQALVDAGVDVLACETIPSKSETVALLDLMRSEFKDTEAWFTFTLRDAEHIADGTSLREIAALFDDAEQVVGLGFNCVPDDLALAALKNLKPLVKRGSLIVYPNSGEQWNAKAREWEGSRTEGEGLASKVVQWEEAGAGMIGGCCRTTPEDIKTMEEALLGRR